MANLNEMDRWQIAQEAMKKLNTLPKKPGDVDPTVVAKPITDYLPFKFENPLPAMRKSYDEVGGGVAGMGAVLGNRVAAGISGAVDMARPDTEPGLISGFKQGFGTSSVTKPVADTRPVETQTQPPVGLPIGGGITVTGVNTSGRAGFSPRTYRDASGNVVASGISSASGQGGFGGALTDAEATRNQVARVEQDAAARENAQSMLRAADLMRQNRIAARGGDPSMETRTTVVDNPLSVPGDSIQDTRARQGEYDRAVEQVLTGNAREQKGATATLAALNALREKNQAVQIAGRKEQAIDPIDTNRFLLDQQKFSWQQGVDRNKAAIEQATLQDKMAGTRMQQQKYGDERRKAFLESYSYPDKNAPQAELGALTLSLSDATKGVVPPEIMSGYLQKAAKEAGVDWEDAPPKSLVALGKRAMELAKQDTQQ